ncbi:MAG: cbb3-type cytochrome oxidase assembly protein CcoS [Proteobacteria bacterium]|nr:cbb3-type cytochrome oxidase assembly protein CcoS [Pseudomonadota bacterium]
MDILYLLVPLSVVLAIAIGAALWWAVRNDQFEDMEGPAHRLLLDDDDQVLPQQQTGQKPPAQADAAPAVPVRHGGLDHPG